MQAYMEHQSFPGVKPNPALRAKLSVYSVDELFAMVEAKDPRRAKTIDRKNPLRLIRALEIIEVLGEVPEANHVKIKNEDYVIFALNPDKKKLEIKIRHRLRDRFKEGMVKEIEGLVQSGVSYKRLEAFGLEYKYIAIFLQKKMRRNDMEVELLREILRYVKRQMTWLKRMETQGWEIHWIKDASEAETFLKK
jgi:tRNA dimethylallyltransferase